MKRKEEIIKAATLLIEQYGVKSVTIEDICSSMNISKKTLYKYFSNKSEIVKAYLIRSFSDFDRILDNQIAGLENPKDLLKALDEAMVDGIISYNSRIVFDLQRHYFELHRVRLTYRKKLVKRIQDIIEFGQSIGTFRAELDPLIMSELRMRQLELILDHNTKREIGELKHEQNQYFDHFIHGVSVA